MPYKCNVPPKRKLEPSPIQELNFSKHKWGKETKLQKKCDISVTKDNLKLIYEHVKDIESKTGKKWDGVLSSLMIFQLISYANLVKIMTLVTSRQGSS